ncbi:p-hydroxybenzoic acid efflux pump subunit AaeB [Enterobacteriaceae bacterium LUAb1]
MLAEFFSYRLRLPLKLTLALLLALFIGFECNLETPRWAVMTAAIVAGGTAFVAGGDPYAGALRHRGMLRIIGTFLGCFAALIIMMLTVRAPVIMLLLCCLWSGFCVWLSSLIKVENSYALGLAGYTALIIVVTADGYGSLQLAPQFAIERCSEIVIGIVCAVLADLVFTPRSIKKDIDQEIECLLIEHYTLLQSCIAHQEKERVDRQWGALVRRTSVLNGMRSNLVMESSHWQNANRRMKAIHTLSLTLITQACETFMILNTRPEYIPAQYRVLFDHPVRNITEFSQRLKVMRRIIAAGGSHVPATISSWVGAASRYLLLMKGINVNARISQTEENILVEEVIIKAPSAETHHAMINGVRTFIATSFGSLFWLWTGWTSGSGCMMMLAVITALAMRTPNPLMMAKDFFYGMVAAFPLGALWFMVIVPATQQSMVLLAIALGCLSFIAGIFIQRRQIGTLGAFVGTLNLLVLNNPMKFEITPFLDNALGQMIGALVAMMVVLLIRDKSKAKTGRKLLNQLMSATVSAMTTNAARRRENHLPALYQQLFLLMNTFPGDIMKFRLALTLIIGHQRLRKAAVPINEDLSAFHRQLRSTAASVVAAKNDSKRYFYYQQLLHELALYQAKLTGYDAPDGVTESIKRLADVLARYQNTLLQI